VLPSSAMAEKGQSTPLKHASSQVCQGLVVVGGLSLCLNVLTLAPALYMFQVYDRVLVSGRVETLVALSAIAACALLCLGALEIIRARALARISTWLDRGLSRSVLQASVGDTLAGLPIGAQGMNDRVQFRGFINSQGIFPIMDAPWTPVFVAVIWLLHPWLGMLALISAVVLFSLALANELVTRAPLADAGWAGLAAQRGHEAALRNAEVVQAMGMLPALLDRSQANREQVLHHQLRASDRTGWIHGTSKFVRLFVQVAILGLGAYLVLQTELTGGGMIAASIIWAVRLRRWSKQSGPGRAWLQPAPATTGCDFCSSVIPAMQDRFTCRSRKGGSAWTGSGSRRRMVVQS
jgi:ATP-binding cassette, subfamily C, type I secretion system permease/ATPase